ncbi:TPA: hypothetical protein N2777_001638 [Vibrio parahaemolyticus]|nr:hypothetical protein [Vibrio parahaemolyticus]
MNNYKIALNRRLSKQLSAELMLRNMVVQNYPIEIFENNTGKVTLKIPVHKNKAMNFKALISDFMGKNNQVEDRDWFYVE